MNAPDPLDSAIPVGSSSTVPPPTGTVPPPPAGTTPPTATVPAGVTGNDKIWACLSHASFLLGFGIVLPLIVYIAMKQESVYVRDNAREALNFHLSVVFYLLCAAALTVIVIGVPLAVLIGLGALVLTIIATIKAADGECYRYPLTIRLIK